MMPPSSQFRGQASEARLTRMWSQLDERLAARRRSRLGWLAVPVLIVLVLVARTATDHAVVSPSNAITFADGSRVDATAANQIELVAVSDARVVVRLLEGRASFQITPNPAREFITQARGYTVRVLGTEYVVELLRDEVSVQVTRGLVEVRRDESDDTWRVAAGESWSSLNVRGEEATAVDAGEPITLPRRKARTSGEDAARLFQRAQDERIAGHPQRAAELLADLLARYPNDARAGVSAFELARLRLDLGDPKGALVALDRARRAGYAMVEQVEMRRVQALEEAGELDTCRAAREAFLARFPESSFAPMVRRRCP